MYNPADELKRAAVEAILNRYHQTRFSSDDLYGFILRDERVQDTLDDLLRLYMTG